MLIDLNACRLIDISQPVTSRSACFPGDVPFSREITLTYKESKVCNLSSLRMSPHVGTHADAPSHIGGTMLCETKEPVDTMAGELPLEPFIGTVAVVDISDFDGEIEFDRVSPFLKALPAVPERVLLKTQKQIRYDIFEENYAHFSVDSISRFSKLGVHLLGIDTPSVDEVRSKALSVHNALLEHKMCWLENLDLTQVAAGLFGLIALPLKFMELEASPVRAVLLVPKER